MNRRGLWEISACCSSDETEWMWRRNGKDHWHHCETQTETNGTADGEDPNISTRWSQQAPEGLMGIRYDGNHGTKSKWSWVWFPLCQKLSNFPIHPLVVYFSRVVFRSIHSEHIVLQCLCTSEMHWHTFRLSLSCPQDLFGHRQIHKHTTSLTIRASNNLCEHHHTDPLCKTTGKYVSSLFHLPETQAER